MCFLENKEEIFVNISSDTYYKLDFCVILNTKYLILNKNSNPKNLFSSPLTSSTFIIFKNYTPTIFVIFIALRHTSTMLVIFIA